MIWRQIFHGFVEAHPDIECVDASGITLSGEGAESARLLVEEPARPGSAARVAAATSVATVFIELQEHKPLTPDNKEYRVIG